MLDLKGYHKNINCGDKIGSVYYDKDNSKGDDWIRITPIPGSDHYVVTWVENGEDVKISLVEKNELEGILTTKENIDSAILVMRVGGFNFACESPIHHGQPRFFAVKLLGASKPDKARELFESWGPFHFLSKSERANLKNLYSYVYTYDFRLEKWYVSHIDPDTGMHEIGELNWWLTERDAQLDEPQKTVTEELIKRKIQKCDYIFPPSGKSCICEIMLENGFTVRGESAVVDESHFNAEVAKQIAYDSAFNKIWPLEGYLLQEKLYREGKTKNNEDE